MAHANANLSGEMVTPVDNRTDNVFQSGREEISLFVFILFLQGQRFISGRKTRKAIVSW